MKKTLLWFNSLSFTIALLLTPSVVPAEKPLLVVTDPWPRYVFESEGKITGFDVEVTRAVFQRLGKEVYYKFYPWKRCLMMVKYKKADAILSASLTADREDFLYFPNEPISIGTNIFFIKAGRTIPYSTLGDLNGLKIGTIMGYQYCNELDNSEFMKLAEPVSTLIQNFRKLLSDRIDVVIEIDTVGFYTAKQMGILNQIDRIPKAEYCQSINYIAFSKEPANKELSRQFGPALLAFKATDAYQQIVIKYSPKVTKDRLSPETISGEGMKNGAARTP